jgi:hypothetical protein
MPLRHRRAARPAQDRRPARTTRDRSKNGRRRRGTEHHTTRRRAGADTTHAGGHGAPGRRPAPGEGCAALQRRRASDGKGENCGATNFAASRKHISLSLALLPTSQPPRSTMASLRAVLPLLPSPAGRTCAAASVAACSGASSSHSSVARLFPSLSSSAHASPRRSYHAPPYGHVGYPGSPVAGAGPAPHEPAGPLHGHGLGWAPTGSALPPSAYAMSTHATTILAVRKGGKVVSVSGLRRPRAAARAGRHRQRDGK